MAQWDQLPFAQLVARHRISGCHQQSRSVNFHWNDSPWEVVLCIVGAIAAMDVWVEMKVAWPSWGRETDGSWWHRPGPCSVGVRSGISTHDWVVVSNIFCFHPYLWKIPILTNIIQMGWNHQLDELRGLQRDCLFHGCLRHVQLQAAVRIVYDIWHEIIFNQQTSIKMGIWSTLPETNSSHLKMDGWNTGLYQFVDFSVQNHPDVNVASTLLACEVCPLRLRQNWCLMCPLQSMWVVEDWKNISKKGEMQLMATRNPAI